MKTVLSNLSSLQCSEADLRTFPSKQQNRSHLKADHDSTLLRGEIYPLKGKPNRQVNEMELPCTDGRNVIVISQSLPSPSLDAA